MFAILYSALYKASVIKTGIHVRRLVLCLYTAPVIIYGATRDAGRSYSGDTRHAFKRCGQKVTGRGELRKLISELNNDIIGAVNGVNGPGY